MPNTVLEILRSLAEPEKSGLRVHAFVPDECRYSRHFCAWQSNNIKRRYYIMIKLTLFPQKWRPRLLRLRLHLQVNPQGGRPRFSISSFSS